MYYSVRGSLHPLASQATNYITSYVRGPLYVSGRIIGEQVRSEVCLLERVREREKEAVFTKPSLALEGGRERGRENRKSYNSHRNFTCLV